MGDKELIRKLNECMLRTAPGSSILDCSGQPFESSKIDWAAVEPRTDVPLDLQATPIGKQAMRGCPAMKGTVYKYWAKCAPPANDPGAFDRSHEIIKDMPPEFNNVVWGLVEDGKDDFIMAATFFV